VVARGRTLRVVGDGAVAVVRAAGGGKPAAVDVKKSGEALDLADLRRDATARTEK
jgi:hypothetical protein